MVKFNILAWRHSGFVCENKDENVQEEAKVFDSFDCVVSCDWVTVINFNRNLQFVLISLKNFRRLRYLPNIIFYLYHLKHSINIICDPGFRWNVFLCRYVPICGRGNNITFFWPRGEHRLHTLLHFFIFLYFNVIGFYSNFALIVDGSEKLVPTLKTY